MKQTLKYLIVHFQLTIANLYFLRSFYVKYGLFVWSLLSLDNNNYLNLIDYYLENL